MDSKASEPIAVVGSACRFPGGWNSPSELWKLLEKPRDVLKRIPKERFDIDAFYHVDPTHLGTTNAESIDPQQRLLMETVYDSLCAAGLPVEDLQGTKTAVYVGMMCDDWSAMVQKDIDVLPMYTGTGTARSIMSNRLSSFFDWHGPSMTIDTACSSSLVAVHEAMRVLRSRESNVAIATGTNRILSPGQFAAESNLRMLSPTGRSRMWDASANGYARGEGVASIALKTLSQAIADGDTIECIIRETGVNQDGRTSGITVPRNVAQTTLMVQILLSKTAEVSSTMTWIPALIPLLTPPGTAQSATLPLPDYMRPSIIIPVNTLPLTVHHKIDRKAVSQIPIDSFNYDQIIKYASSSRELNPIEIRLEGMWRDIIPTLAGRDITHESNFFHVGGSSLLLLQLQRLIKKVFQASPRLNELMIASKLQDMASTVRANMSSIIDWDMEIAIPDGWEDLFTLNADLASPRPRIGSRLWILVTGATGYVDRFLAPLLAASDKVEKLFCLVRPETNSEKLRSISDKVEVFAADLSRPNLALSDTEKAFLASNAPNTV
ncbi:uncharacterized protein FTOL_11909 [Fusarium torulosum]|uniref:Polyketide synthase n=1 Tax=Fusarium torulosum TaxID=33205 RepID=A0AAE8SNV8_9HYPO|nr:uncharacterized protein FTOL_11909 [Fusarium torulosum]